MSCAIWKFFSSSYFRQFRMDAVVEGDKWWVEWWRRWRQKKRRSSKTLIIFVENKYPDNRLPVQTAASALIQYYFWLLDSIILVRDGHYLDCIWSACICRRSGLWCLAESDWKIGVLNTSTWTIKWSDRIGLGGEGVKETTRERQKQWSPHKQNSKKRLY